jgi:lipooligosaccharide transport system permease protein
MVTTAMVVAAAESMWPVMGNFMWSRGYFGVAATPLGAADIVGGHALWMAVRCAVTSASVAAVLVLFPAARSWGLIPAIGAAALTGVAFAMPLMAYAAPRKLDGGFPAMQRFVIIPLFLFGGAFYPISQLPGWTQAIIKLLPLWHGIELARGFTLGGAQWSTTVTHVAVICVWIVGGTILSYRFVRRRLYV